MGVSIPVEITLSGDVSPELGLGSNASSPRLMKMHSAFFGGELDRSFTLIFALGEDA